MAQDETTRVVDPGIGEMLSLLSTKRMTQALGILQRFDMMTWPEFDDFLTVGVVDPMVQASLFAKSRTDREHLPFPSMVPGLEVELRKALTRSFMLVDRVGGITGLGAMVFEPQADLDSWAIYNPGVLTVNFTRGQFATMSGVPGAGKTNGFCVISERAISEGTPILSNVTMMKPVPGYTYVGDAKALLAAVALLPPEASWIFGLDEGGLIASKKDAMTKRVKELEGLFRVIRKLHGNVVFIEQRKESVPTILQEWSRMDFYAVSPGIMHLNLHGTELTFKRTVKWFPKTSLPFDTDDIAYFPINVNISAMLEELSGEPDVKAAMGKFIGSGGRAPVQEADWKVGWDRKCVVCGAPVPPTHHLRTKCDRHTGRSYIPAGDKATDARTQ